MDASEAGACMADVGGTGWRCRLRNSEACGRFERNDAYACHVAPAQAQETVMHDVIYLVGLVVVVLFILSALGLR
jgi:hypothetical protein